jgi:hypothetical protein
LLKIYEDIGASRADDVDALRTDPKLVRTDRE